VPQDGYFFEGQKNFMSTFWRCVV